MTKVKSIKTMNVVDARAAEQLYWQKADAVQTDLDLLRLDTIRATADLANAERSAEAMIHHFLNIRGKNIPGFAYSNIDYAKETSRLHVAAGAAVNKLQLEELALVARHRKLVCRAIEYRRRLTQLEYAMERANQGAVACQ